MSQTPFFIFLSFFSFTCFSPPASTSLYLLDLKKIIPPLACSSGTYPRSYLWMQWLSSSLNLGRRGDFGQTQSHLQGLGWGAAGSQGLQEGLKCWSCHATELACAPSVTLGSLCCHGKAEETLIWQQRWELWQGILTALLSGGCHIFSN